MLNGIKIDSAQIPEIELRILYAAVLDATLRFYENPKNMADFERWLAERKGGEVVGQKVCDKTQAGAS